MLREADREYGCMETTGRALVLFCAIVVGYTLIGSLTCSGRDGPAMYTIGEAERLQVRCAASVAVVDLSAPRCTALDEMERRCLAASRAIRRVSDSGLNAEQVRILQEMQSDAGRQVSLVRRLKEAPCL